MEHGKRHYIVGKQYGRLKEKKEHTSKMNQGLMFEDCKQQNGKMMAIEKLKSVVGQ